MGVVHGVTIVGLCLCVTIGVEILLWVWMYKTRNFEAMKTAVEKAKKKVDIIREERRLNPPAPPASASSSSASRGNQKAKRSKDKDRDKKLEKAEMALASANRDVVVVRFKSTVVLAIALFALYTLLSMAYDGIVVAKLPFEPYEFVKRLSHRLLVPPTAAGDEGGAAEGAVPEAIDPAVLDAFQTDCGMPFLYALCTMAFRVNIQKLFGTGPPQTNNAFALATGEEMQIH